MMKLRILPVRVDGNTRIGCGHFYRTLSLANILRGKYQCFFFYRELDENLIKKITKEGFDQCKIPWSTRKTDEGKIIKIIPHHFEKWIIIDGYEFDDEYQESLRKTGFKIINIADEESSISLSDLVISQAPRKSGSSSAKIFSGFDYALLRQEFYKEIPATRQIFKTESAYLLFGSSNLKGFSSKILNSFLQFPSIKNINIIRTSEKMHADELNPIIERNKDKIHLYYDLDARELIDLIKMSDIGFAPSSVASLEACTVGLGLFSGYSAENQIDTYLNHVRLKTIFPLGDLSKVSEQIIHSIMMKELDNARINLLIKNQKEAFKNGSNLILKIFDDNLP